MNIEEIKTRLSNLDEGKVIKYDHAMNLATQYMVDYKNDVTYLLSIIEQAEKALNLIRAQCSLYPQRTGNIVEISGEALKSIQGDA